MSTEERIAQLEQQVAELKAEFYKNNFPQQKVFVKDVLFKGNTTFTGTASWSSLNPSTSFGLGVTPAGRQANITAPTGGATVDNESRNAIISILNVLDTFGFTL